MGFVATIITFARSGLPTAANRQAAVHRRATYSQKLAQRHLLQSARLALEDHRTDEAETLIREAGEEMPHDCVAWNLLGVVNECRANWKQARRCYGKAMAADSSFAAAQQNMRRIYELYTFGQSTEPIAFGVTDRQWCSPDISQTKGTLVSTPS